MRICLWLTSKSCHKHCHKFRCDSVPRNTTIKYEDVYRRGGGGGTGVEGAESGVEGADSGVEGAGSGGRGGGKRG